MKTFKPTSNEEGSQSESHLTNEIEINQPPQSEERRRDTEFYHESALFSVFTSFSYQACVFWR